MRQTVYRLSMWLLCGIGVVLTLNVLGSAHPSSTGDLLAGSLGSILIMLGWGGLRFGPRNDLSH